MTIRPYGIVINGKLELGLEAIFDGATLSETRPHTGIPDPFVLSPAFVNAHSHLEYRGLQGKLRSTDFFEWIREITQAKIQQNSERVLADCMLAAEENRRTGVAVIAEHSDRPGAIPAIANTGIQGVVFQELITFFDDLAPDRKLEEICRTAELRAAKSKVPVFVSPHAAYTVHERILKSLARSNKPVSIHAAESSYENDLISCATGPFADFEKSHGRGRIPTGESLIGYLVRLGFCHQLVQFVHCCAVSDADLVAIRESRASVAHCPRSNEALGCPIAPVRRMLEAGIRVGLGLDSAASSGPIDYFAEMQCALRVSNELGEPLTAEQVWQVGTTDGLKSLPYPVLAKEQELPWIKIHVENAWNTAEIIELGSPDRVEWLT